MAAAAAAAAAAAEVRAATFNVHLPLLPVPHQCVKNLLSVLSTQKNSLTAEHLKTRNTTPPPVCEELVVCLVHLDVWDLEGDDLVRLRGEQQILVLLIRGLGLLLVRRHEAVTGLGVLLDLGVLHLRAGGGGGQAGGARSAGRQPTPHPHLHM